MEEQRLENYLRMPEHDLITYKDDIFITCISIPILQAHAINLMRFCVDTGAPHSFIRNKELERAVRHSGCRYITAIDSKQDFKFGDTLVRKTGMVERMLPKPGSNLDIPVILDVPYVNIPDLPG